MPALPDEFQISNARITNNNVVVQSESRALILLQRKTPGQRWEFRLRTKLITPDEADVIWAFYAAREQDLDVIDIKIPRYSYSEIPSKSTSASASVGATSITVSNSTSLQVGKYMQFAGHSKVYLVTGIDANQITFAPNLVSSVISGETISFNEIVWSCKFARRPRRFEIDSANGENIEMELDVVEAL